MFFTVVLGPCFFYMLCDTSIANFRRGVGYFLLAVGWHHHHRLDMTMAVAEVLSNAKTTTTNSKLCLCVRRQEREDKMCVLPTGVSPSGGVGDEVAQLPILWLAARAIRSAVTWMNAHWSRGAGVGRAKWRLQGSETNEGGGVGYLLPDEPTGLHTCASYFAVH